MSKSVKNGEVLLAIDGGGTHTRCAAYTLDGQQLAVGYGGPSNHLAVSNSQALDSIQTAIANTLHFCNLKPDDIQFVSAGFAGVDYDGAGAPDMETLLAEAGYPKALIFGDMVTAHAGALNGQPGILVLAGTGAVYFGTSSNGSSLKLGGFGYAFGDEGGGYWIANEALRAASKAYDLRAESTCLVTALSHALGVTEFSQIPRLLYLEPLQATLIAQLSHTVQVVAEKGDRVASQILDRAGCELAIGAATLAERLDSYENCFVSYSGSILQKCTMVLDAFQKQLQLRLPAATIHPPVFDALYGAYLLGKRRLTSLNEGDTSPSC